MSSEIVSSDRGQLWRRILQELGQAGRSLLLEQLHYYSGCLSAFPPFDHPLFPPRIIEWLSPKLLQPGVWLILHLALVLLSRNFSRTWFSFCSLLSPKYTWESMASKFPTLVFFEWLGFTAYLEGLLFSSMLPFGMLEFWFSSRNHWVLLLPCIWLTEWKPSRGQWLSLPSSAKNIEWTLHNDWLEDSSKKIVLNNWSFLPFHSQSQIRNSIWHEELHTLAKFSSLSVIPSTLGELGTEETHQRK